MTGLSIILICAFIIAAGFYAGAEMGYYRLNRVRLSLRLKEGRRSAARLDSAIRRPDEFVIMALIGQNLFVFLSTLLCTRLYEPDWAERAEFMATLTLLVPVFIFGEVLPKELFARAADTLMYALGPALVFSMRMLRPVVFILMQLQRVWKIFPRWRAPHAEVEVERVRLQHFFSESAQEGTLSAYQHAMAANIMKLQKQHVEDVMIPTASVVSLRTHQTLEECRDLARVCHYRRYPVVDERGDYVGFVNMLDIIAAGDGPFDLHDYLRRPVVFNQDESTIQALHQLKRSAGPMGFVEDDSGRIIGIVSIKDLVEEIVGELGAW